MDPLLLPNLKTKWLGKTTYEFEEVPSTQDVLRKELNVTSLSGLTILSKKQTKGRGRQGRVWVNLPGEQIFASIYIKSSLPLEKLPILNIAAGLGVCDALDELGVRNVAMKWPNDVFISGKKVSGILSELIQVQGKNAILLGLGLNIEGKSQDFPIDLREKMTTLSLHISNPDRLKILSTLFNHIESWIDSLEKDGPTPVQIDFKRRFVYSGLSISMDVGGQPVTGIATDIDPLGALLLKTGTQTYRIVSGDISTTMV